MKEIIILQSKIYINNKLLNIDKLIFEINNNLFLRKKSL